MMMQCRWWQTFLVVLVVYSAWASPFELAFKKVATGSLLPVDLLVDAFFALDIVLTFFVAYLDKSTYLLVDDHKKIAVRYVNFFTHSKYMQCEMSYWSKFKIYRTGIRIIENYVLWQLPYKPVVPHGRSLHSSITGNTQNFDWKDVPQWGLRFPQFTSVLATKACWWALHKVIIVKVIIPNACWLLHMQLKGLG